MHHHNHLALQNSSQEIKSSALKHQEDLVDDPGLDKEVPVLSEVGPAVADVARYLDEQGADQASDAIAVIAGLAEHIRDRRQLQIDLRGVIYDPIDDAVMIPRIEDVRRYMNAEHLDQYSEILDALYGPIAPIKTRRIMGGAILSRIFPKRP